MSEVIAAIVVAVGVILSPFVAPLEWLGWVAHPRYGSRLKVYDLLDVHFINEQGQNIYFKNDKPTLQFDDPSWFNVKVRFKLRAKEFVCHNKHRTAYPDLVASSGEQAIRVDGQSQLSIAASA